MDDIIFHRVEKGNELDILKGQESTFRKFSYKYDEETINFLKKNLNDNDSLYLIARKGDEFAAFVSIDGEWWEGDSLFIREIFVASDFQKQQIGRKLMEKCIEHTSNQGVKTIVTQTAFDNIPMQKLCEKLGFLEWNNPQWDEGITYKLKVV